MKKHLNYKTGNIDIMSAVTLGQVIPEDTYIKNVDTSIVNLFSENQYQGQNRNYTQDIEDYSYKSLQDIKANHRRVIEDVSQKKQTFDDLNKYL